MARPIVLSNGELHVGINNFGLVHDFYFPYVGLENHAAARSLRHKVGVWVDGNFSWLDDGQWQFSIKYAQDALIGHIRASHPELQLVLEFDDCVDASQSAFLRSIHVVNAADHERDVRLFMHQVFTISNSLYADTVQYLPDQPAIMHYKGRRVFIISGRVIDGTAFDQHCVGLYGIEGHEGSYRDAEDGELSGNAIEHGSVDSVIRFRLQLPAHESAHVEYWCAAGTSQREALVIHNRLSENGVNQHMNTTHTHWQQWLQPAKNRLQHLDEPYKQTLLNSLLIMKSHIDKRGAVIASTDTSMLNYARDAYAYCWPRDAAYIIWPLIRLGYKDEPMQFFNFCKRIIHPNGYVMHKYQADGALGSSWHPYTHGDDVGPPIQEDETAIMLFILAQYFQLHHDDKQLNDYFETLVLPMANFLADYVNPDTKLPKPSYDLWEENYLTSTYTTAITYAGLCAAVELADKVGKSDEAVRWRSVADDMQTAARHHLYDKTKGYIIKGFRIQDGSINYDTTLDSSAFFGAFMFGLWDLKDEHISTTYDAIRSTLAHDDGYGIPRYEHDNYNRVDAESMSNPWFITSLWMAQYAIETGDSARGREIIDWCLARSFSTGVLSEQINPLNDEALSVAPLAWSHAELISTLLDINTPTDRA